jgi:hypothetical protein
VKILEDEADTPAPQPGQRPLAEVVDALPAEPHLAVAGPVKTAEELQQRGLAAAAGPGHRERLPGRHVEVDPVDGPYQALVLPVHPRQADRPQQRPVRITGVAADRPGARAVVRTPPP